MFSVRLLLLFPFLCFLPGRLVAQQAAPETASQAAATEICDNGLDDDGDGLIDCYDPECPCEPDIPCSIASLPSTFAPRLAWQSTKDAASEASTPVVGNMNPQVDQMPEIIVTEAYSLDGVLPYPNNRILFFRGDGSNAANPKVLTIPGTTFAVDPPGPTIGDVDGNGIPELLITCNDRRIRVYTNYTEAPGAPMTLWMASTDLVDYAGQRPLLADFDGDGISEVYVGSDIFRFDFTNPAAPTLTRALSAAVYLGTNSMGRCYWRNYLRTFCSPAAADLLTPADCNGDPDCNGMELAAGPAIYSIDLDPNDGDGYEIKMQRRLPHTAILQYYDGYTSVADMDLDGVLDVIVSSKINADHGVYVWNKNGLIQFFPYLTNSFLSGGLPCINNVYDDRTAGFARDLPEIIVTSGFEITAFNLNAAQLTPAQPSWWNYDMTGSGNDGKNPPIAFDFNGDGIQEILFRGGGFRFLYGGAAPFPPGVGPNRLWNYFPFGTNNASDEYAVVADVDNDGETEIAGVFTVDNVAFGFLARLQVYESNQYPWVPSRNLWNQYNYHITNVNDDLSIPAQEQSSLVETPPGSGKYPLNIYLSQRPAKGGKIPLPDAAAQVQELYCQNNQLRVKLEVCNQGNKVLKTGTPVAVYQSDPRSTNALLHGLPGVLTAPLEPDSCAVFDLALPPFTGPLFAVVNDDGSLPRPFNLATDFPATTEYECDWLNNIVEFKYDQASAAVDLGPDLALCADTVLTLRAGPGHGAYLWQDNSTDSVLVAKTPGLYWVRVQDPCIGSRTDSIRIEVFGRPQLQIDTLNGDCNGMPGSAAVAVNSLHPPFQYQWTGGSTGAAISGVPDGLYTVTVTDAIGCSSVASTWLEAGGLLQVSAVSTPIPCPGQTGSIELAIQAGAASLVFAWSNNTSGSSLQNVLAGTYSVTVTDADACSRVIVVPLPDPPPLVLNGLNITGACPGAANGSAAFADISNGTAPFALNWSDNTSGPSLQNAPAGAYTLSVTDAKGCSLVESFSVPALSAPLLDSQVEQVSCFGAADGSIDITLSGGTPGFGYAWSNSAGTAGIQNLGPGHYALTLTYANGHCSDVFDFQVTEPGALLSAGITATPSCPGTDNGAAMLTGISQGTAPYAYLWSDGATTSPGLSGVPAGTYTVVVTDAQGCSLSETVSIGIVAAPVIDSLVVPVSCFGLADGSIALSVSGGTPDVTFQWSNGPNTPGNPALAAGAYTLTLGYAGGQCTQDLVFQITEPTPLVAGSLTTSGACPGLANGTVFFAGVSQGSPPYVLEWSTGSNSPVLSGVATGEYSFTVTDARGCTLSDTILVPAFVLPALDTLASAVSCFGLADGSISLGIPGNIPGVSFAWSNSANTPNIQGLAAGAYALTLTYANGACTQVFDFQINEPLPLLSGGVAAQASCPGINNGSATLLGISQGTAPYDLLWSDGTTTTPEWNGLAPGTYTVLVTDAQGCTLSESVQVPGLTAPLVDVLATPVSCAGLADGSIALSVSGGTPGIGFQWSNGPTGPDNPALAAGAYTLTVTYAGGLCTQVLDVQITAPAPLLSAGISTAAACPGQTNGSASFLGASQGNAPYALEWSTGSTLPDLMNIAAGNYQLTITDARGCTLEEVVLVPAFEAPGLDSVVQHISCFGNADGSIALALTGGSPGFSFAWSNSANTADIQDLGPGTYTLNLGFANGVCTQVLDFQIQEPLPLLSAGITATAACPGEANGSASFAGASQGTAPYTWQWSTGSTGAGLNNLVSGNYALTLSDARGCSLVESVQVPAFEAPLLQAALEDVRCFGDANGSISVSLSGGSPGFAYAWSTGANGPAISSLGPGTYTLTLDYANGQCALEEQFQLAEPVLLQALAAQTADIQCFGDASGAIVVSPAGGVAPYQFTWPGGQSSSSLSQLTAGNYTVTLTDAKGCSSTASITLSQPEALALAPDITPDTCVAGVGAASVLPSGGTPPYAYAWSGGATSPGISGLVAGTYTLTLSDAVGCSEVLALAVPAVDASPALMPFSDTITCRQPAVTIGVLADQSGLHYAWTGPAGLLPDQASQQVSLPGSYQVQVTNAYGCVVAAQLLVPEDRQPPLAEAGAAVVQVPCQQTSWSLDAGPGSSVGPGLVAQWYRQTPAGPVLVASGTMLTLSEPGLYIFSNLNTRNGCVAADSVLVDWVPPIQALASIDSISCFGETDGSIQVQPLGGGSPPFVYSIDNQAFSPNNIFQNLGPGVYPVVVRDAGGCLWQSSVTLSQPPPFSVSLLASDTLVDLGHVVLLQAKPLPAGVMLADVQWQPAGFGIQPGELRQRVQPEETTQYLVQLTDERGCTATDRVTVAVVSYQVYAPNAISPGSAQNGVFTLYAAEGIPTVRLLRVYDRWGSLVFENKNFAPGDPAAGWDGAYRGQTFTPGVFVWYAELEGQDGRLIRLSGDVTVVD